MVFLAIILASIAFHEYGHYLAARLMNLSVAKFAVGFGPRLLWWTDKLGTQWSLRLVPLGGYVELPDRDRERMSAWGQMFLFVAGPVFTLFLTSLAMTLYTFWRAEEFLWLAYINATMGIFNLLPIPPLDGGQMMLAAIELKRGREWVKRREIGMSLAGMMMIIGITLMLIGSNWQFAPGTKWETKHVEKKHGK